MGASPAAVTASGNGEHAVRGSDTLGDVTGKAGQLHLFDGQVEEVSTRRRIALDAGSWVELVGRWIEDSEALFARLLVAARWEQRHRRMYEEMVLEPRLTAEVPNLAEGGDPRLIELADALGREYGVRYDSLWMNLYRDQRDSTAWHADRFSCRREQCIVPVLTLGAPRRFLLKPRAGGRSIGFQPASGDLLVMGGRCQRDWVHSVPKATGVLGPRISVNFQSSEQAHAGERRSTPRARR